ncbi:TKL family protein kinase [Trichomonas vaginalis G3]|uniref:TKL family protein kinase n=1 Tax=Trichomonas vaginalis (strain ATCC PRA-98 / G3) TaxID=412133 RepID=A2DBB4_TRIV3|nr:protein kinase protein [Trichomonas vaginalis G3]EAY22444.1 TKL family protein kinase [Trichomonas vaginalis G3]KAI5517605.1 protein kinase protein [Trichomonas vaginalis G3]|eukprot:XP_001583430.1 TKL family protein kinase [Trichomonas vaginalis G3]
MIPSDMPANILELVKALPEYVREESDYDCDSILGKGGFGEVWHAVDKKSKKECAVKKLFATTFDAKLQRLYIQEIFMTACCQDESVIRLMGFTVKKPFCIITQYQKNGSLQDYVYPGMKFFNSMQPNHLTMVAMQMARGLHKCQKQNIVHRDIKPGNVLIDEKFMPIICDFGIAGIIDFEHPMTRRCGTLAYMAPELYNSKFYDTYADVFSYGIILYEMSEKKHAYDGETRESMKAILKDGHVRPKFSNKTPEKMRELIERCWDFNPDNRPSFGQIYKMFAEGKVGFEGYDKHKMKVLAKQLNALRRHPHKPKQRCDLNSTINYVQKTYADVIAHPEQFNTEDSDKKKKKSKDDDDKPENKEESDNNKQNSEEVVSTPKPEISVQPKNRLNINILKDPANPQFFEHLHEISTTIQDNEILPFVSTTFPIMQNSQSEYLTSHIQVAYCEGMTTNDKFIKFMNEKNLIANLPMKSPLIVSHSFNIFAIFLSRGFEIVTDQYADWVNFYLQKVNPEGTLNAVSALFSKLNGNFTKVTKIFSVFVLNGPMFFNLPCASNYISFLFYVLQISEQEQNIHLPTLKNYLMHYLRSEKMKMVGIAYTGLSYLYDGLFPLDFQLMELHSKNPAAQNGITGLLIRLQDNIFQIPNIFNILLNCSESSSKSLSLLMEYVTRFPETATRLSVNSTWFIKGLPNAGGTLRLAMFGFLHPKMRVPFLQNSLLGLLFSFLASHPDNWILGSLYFLIINMKADAKILTQFQKNNFLSKFVSNLSKLTDMESATSACLLLEYSAKLIKIPDPDIVVDSIIHMMKQFPPIIGLCARVLMNLSAIIEMKPVMKMKNLQVFFQKLSSDQNYGEISRTAIANLS